MLSSAKPTEENDDYNSWEETYRMFGCEVPYSSSDNDRKIPKKSTTVQMTLECVT